MGLARQSKVVTKQQGMKWMRNLIEQVLSNMRMEGDY